MSTKKSTILKISPFIISGLAGMGLSTHALSAELDFSNLPAGTVVKELSTGAGITGKLGGKVSVWGHNPKISNKNSAVVFDSSEPSGEDLDLGTPNETFGGSGVGLGGESGKEFKNATALENVLIIAEDLEDANHDGLIDDPDDADWTNMSINLNFAKTKKRGHGTVTVNSITYMDLELDQGEGGSYMKLSGPNIETSLVQFPNTGNNGVHTISGIGLEGVENIVITLNGSSAIASLTVEEDSPRICWITTGGFQNAGSQSGGKDFTFGGNVGPSPSGSWEVVDHNTGDNFHSNIVNMVECTVVDATGPGQPGGKKGLITNKASFEGTGRLNGVHGYPFVGYVIDAGEAQGKKGKDHDYYEIVVRDPDTDEIVFEASGNLDGGNVQIHPAN